MRDVRLALRALRRTPSFTATAVVILTVGIGMAIAMTTVYDAVLVERLPVADQSALIAPRPVDHGGVRVDPSARDAAQLARDSRTLRGVASVWHYGAVTSPMFEGDRTVTLAHAVVSANFFQVLGAHAVLGRMLRAEDGEAGAAPVLVLSYGAWQRRFGGDPNVVGRQLINPYTLATQTIVGVAPPGLDYPAGVEYWDSFTPDNDITLAQIIARRAPGASTAAIQSEFLQFMRRVDEQRHIQSSLLSVEVPSFADTVFGDARPMLTLLIAAVALLLLIACVNVGGLLLVRASARAREIAVRRALGASFGDIVRQLFAESMILAVCAGALGLGVAMLLLRALSRVGSANLPRLDSIGVHALPVGVALVVTAVAVCLFGIAPAVIAARSNLNSTLRLDARGGTESRSRRRVRELLVTGQVALALVTLAGAGLLARSLDRLQHVDLGYTADHLAVFSIAYPADRFDTPEKLASLGEQVLPRLQAIPGVVGVTPITSPPFMGSSVFIAKLATAAQSDAEADANPFVPFEVGGADYFRTMGIPVVRGRGFTTADRAGAQKSLVVSESFAARMWPGQDPLGQRLRTPHDTSNAYWTVVGVAGDTHFRALRDATAVVYMPWEQSFWGAYMAVRTSGSLAAVLPAMQRAVEGVDSHVKVWNARTMDELLAAPLARPRLSTVILSAFAFVALLLAALGLYGVMASSVREQTRELGVRMALGATAERLRGEVLRRAMRMMVGGAVVGLAATVLTSRLLASMLFQVTPTDPLTLAGAVVLLLLVALGAAYLPAQRATRIDPARALRAD